MNDDDCYCELYCYCELFVNDDNEVEFSIICDKHSKMKREGSIRFDSQKVTYHEDEDGILRGVCPTHGEFIGDAIGCPACFAEEEEADAREQGEETGFCDGCGVELPIGRGDNFFWNDELEEWFCEKCNEQKEHIVFVYGSLRKGEFNHYILEDTEFLGEFEAQGFEMYSLGGFPGIKHAQGQSIKVEAYRILHNGVFERINAMELGAGYEAFQTEIGGLKGVIYVYTGSVQESWKVQGGDWTRRAK